MKLYTKKSSYLINHAKEVKKWKVFDQNELRAVNFVSSKLVIRRRDSKKTKNAHFCYLLINFVTVEFVHHKFLFPSSSK